MRGVGKLYRLGYYYLSKPKTEFAESPSFSASEGKPKPILQCTLYSGVDIVIIIALLVSRAVYSVHTRITSGILHTAQVTSHTSHNALLVTM